MRYKGISQLLLKLIEWEINLLLDISHLMDIILVPNFPNEYTGLAYTYTLKGANVKAKANAVQGIPEMIEIATGGNYKANEEEKHSRNAKWGWYRYDTYFAIPVHASDGEVDHYNVFHASLLIRHSEDGKKYLYDIIDIKKETSYPLEP